MTPPRFLDAHWRAFFPDDAIISDDIHCLMDQSTFEKIPDYTQSRPTGASPGRIYRKNLGWPDDMPDNWFVYICESREGDPGGVYHVGKPSLVIATEVKP